MRLGLVIGRVTLSRSIPCLRGGRFLIVTPFDREHYKLGAYPGMFISSVAAPVVYDNLGGGLGQTIGYVEGREASMPFDEPTPVDAISIAIIDDVFYQPES